MQKRKIVKVTYKNGKVDYKVKKRIFPFIWITDSYDYWYGPGICEVVCRHMTLKQVENYMECIRKKEEERKGSKIIEENDL